MSKIIDQARPLHMLYRPMRFIDSYEWQIDENRNHRLICHDNDQASDWAPFQSIVVLNERMVATEHWQGILPINMLLRWEALPNPS